MANDSQIVDVITSLYHIPLPEVMGDAKHGMHTHFDVPIVKVIVQDGRQGIGYTYTGGLGGRAIASLIEHDLRPFLLGQDASCVESLWDAMQWKIHYIGRGGLASFAISAVDIALWDLRAKKADEPLWKLLGGADNSVKAYAGAIDLNFPLEKLLQNNRTYLERGFRAVKIKLGQERLEEDIERIAAVRELIGPDVDLMVDANMKWSVATAITAAKRMKPYNVLWLEEPTIPEDYDGYLRISERGGIPIAAGENYRTIYEFACAMTRGKIDFPQPDASNIGGITGWLKVAHLAQTYNLPVCSHGMQELHVSLLSAMPNGAYLEVHSFPIDAYTTRPLVLQDGRAVAPNVTGTGVEFRWDLLEPFEQSR
ncbi:mandelate racemase/muconate lactonizing enzyme family protein [Alicyclobacillus cycloheptanicus]|uniref:L-alanine-DL-glutamate epimerase-like enolase superfamily enzyme n=1 Tax=Alicyclobacillus cycloheptanicus TaxID=1457 RepID=A0ABT9XII9_9BACL|nr:mandelate racemase/muconate lactonizing enzyme family protein [Alicyclobacillus cycloheptanicus]MDQ0189526.1 L-alanine-DL-glutamate epimerase-like enolase superfamily enzyme [Alicyclobacillus cycloheptanicus]WDM01585.1 mandelate racemase/muconate lactonizing enzyme family protein [Alicyclobacillus cycloheptanicus]